MHLTIKMILFIILQSFLFSSTFAQTVNVVNKTDLKTIHESKRYNSDTLNYMKKFGIINCQFAECPTNISEIKTAKTMNKFNIIVDKCNNKKYMFSHNEIRYGDIWNECCEHGMVPATINSHQEFICVQTAYAKQKNIFPPGEIERFFTSYVDAILNKDFVSCTTGKKIQTEVWSRNEPELSKSLDTACVAFYARQNLRREQKGLKTENCNSIRGALCEVPVEPHLRIYPAEAQIMQSKDSNKYYDSSTISFFVSKSLFNCKAAYCSRGPSASPIYDNITFNTCGRDLMVSYTKIPLADIWQTCCKLGMIPAALHHIHDQKCFVSKFLIAKGKMELEYNTGMTDPNLDNTFQSCRSGLNLQPNTWLKDEPDNISRNKACTVFKILDSKTFGFSTTKCDVERPFICQVQDTNKKPEKNKPKDNTIFLMSNIQPSSTKFVTELTTFATTSAPIIKNPTSTSSSISATSVNNLLFSNYSLLLSQLFTSSRLYKCELFACTDKVSSLHDSGDNAKVPETAGVLIKKCGVKKYLFTNKKVAFIDTWKECCSYGMIPASIENKDELKCLHQNYFIMQGRKDVSNLFFTAQMDAYLERRFVSCASANFVPQDLWWKNEPDNKESREACVALKFDNFTAGLVDSRCGEHTNALCETASNFEKYSNPRILVTTSTTKKPTYTTTTTKTTTTQTKYASIIISSTKTTSKSIAYAKSYQSITSTSTKKVSIFIPVVASTSKPSLTNTNIKILTNIGSKTTKKF